MAWRVGTSVLHDGAAMENVEHLQAGGRGRESCFAESVSKTSDPLWNLNYGFKASRVSLNVD